MKSVNLLRIKELKLDNLSTINMDFLSSKDAKCKDNMEFQNNPIDLYSYAESFSFIA